MSTAETATVRQQDLERLIITTAVLVRTMAVETSIRGMVPANIHPEFYNLTVLLDSLVATLQESDR